MFTTISNIGIDEFGNVTGQKLYFEPSAILETAEGTKIIKSLETLIQYFENNAAS
jgi:hypothetical protein